MMKRKPRVFAMIASMIAMLCLIFDSQCAARSASDAITLCLETVIPSLFPMFVLSGLMISGMSSDSSKIRHTLESICHLPEGTGTIFLLGLIGGFPVGAQCIVQAVSRNNLSRKDGERMLGFCNNCSPSFLFGILGGSFHDKLLPWSVFLIQMECAFLVAILWPGEAGPKISFQQKALTISDAVFRAVKSMVSVCSWVILAGVLSGFLEKWLFPLIPPIFRFIITGMIELTGGILSLQHLANESLQLILCTGFICFGGICVLFQIQSIAAGAGLSMKTCVRQKMLQSFLALVLSIGWITLGPASLLLALLPAFLWKKRVEKPNRTMYNSIHKGGF